ncbi:MAG: hypothetical protein ABFD98_12265, partial [Syntrophobacteraceae bacterium]
MAFIDLAISAPIACDSIERLAAGRGCRTLPSLLPHQSHHAITEIEITMRRFFILLFLVAALP